MMFREIFFYPFSTPSRRFLSGAWLTVFSCFLILFLHPNKRINDNSILTDAIKDKDFLMAAAMSVGCTFPMTIEIIFHFFGNVKNHDLVENFFVIACLALPYIYVMTDHDNPSATAVFPVLIIAGTNVILGAIFSYLSRVGNYPYTVRCLEFAYVFYVLISIFRTFAMYEKSDQLYLMSSYMHGINSLSLLMAITVFRQSGGFDFGLIFRLLSPGFRPLTPEEYCWLMYFISLVLVHISLILTEIFTTGKNWAETDSINLISMTYSKTLFTVAACLLPGRLIRQKESVTEAELSMQRAFVSYVTQELRTPLIKVSSQVQNMKGELFRLSSQVNNTYNLMRSRAKLKPSLTCGLVSFPIFSRIPSSSGGGINGRGGTDLTVNFLNKISSIGDAMDKSVTTVMMPSCEQANIIISDLLVYNTMGRDLLVLNRRAFPVATFLQSIITALLQTHACTSGGDGDGSKETTSEEDEEYNSNSAVLNHKILLETNEVGPDDNIYIDHGKVEAALKSLIGNMLYYDYNYSEGNGCNSHIVVSLEKSDKKCEEAADLLNDGYFQDGSVRISIKMVCRNEFDALTDPMHVEESIIPDAEDAEDTIHPVPSTSFGNMGDMIAQFNNNFGGGLKHLKRSVDTGTTKKEGGSCVSSVNLWMCRRVIDLHHGTVEVVPHQTQTNSSTDVSGNALHLIGDISHIRLPVYMPVVLTSRLVDANSRGADAGDSLSCESLLSRMFFFLCSIFRCITSCLLWFCSEAKVSDKSDLNINTSRTVTVRSSTVSRKTSDFHRNMFEETNGKDVAYDDRYYSDEDGYACVETAVSVSPYDSYPRLRGPKVESALEDFDRNRIIQMTGKMAEVDADLSGGSNCTTVSQPSICTTQPSFSAKSHKSERTISPPIIGSMRWMNEKSAEEFL